jgi:hypothetical protein
MKDSTYDLAIECVSCHGVGKDITDAGRQILELLSVVEARVDARMDARYGPNNPNDPRNRTHQ